MHPCCELVCGPGEAVEGAGDHQRVVVVAAITEGRHTRGGGMQSTLIEVTARPAGPPGSHSCLSIDSQSTGSSQKRPAFTQRTYYTTHPWSRCASAGRPVLQRAVPSTLPARPAADHSQGGDGVRWLQWRRGARAEEDGRHAPAFRVTARPPDRLPGCCVGRRTPARACPAAPGGAARLSLGAVPLSVTRTWADIHLAPAGCRRGVLRHQPGEAAGGGAWQRHARGSGGEGQQNGKEDRARFLRLSCRRRCPHPATGRACSCQHTPRQPIARTAT